MKRDDDRRRVIDIVRRCSYPPASIRPTSIDDEPTLVGIQVSREVEDSDNPLETITVSTYINIPTRAPEELVVRAVWIACRDLEMHEAGEWFRYGDERPFHPHRKSQQGVSA